MAECTSGEVCVLVMDYAEAQSLTQLILDHMDEVHTDPSLEAVGLALGAI